MNARLQKYFFETDFETFYHGKARPFKIKDIEYGYRRYVDSFIEQLELEQIGNQYLTGDDYLRLTYRFFEKKVTENYGTSLVFPVETSISYLASPISSLQTPIDERIQN